MTKRFLIREEVTDCNVGDVLKTENDYEVLCTEKRDCACFTRKMVNGLDT